MYKSTGVNGISLSTSIVATFDFVALVFLMRRQINGMGGRALMGSMSRMCVAGAVLGGVSWGIWRLSQGFFETGFWAQLLVVFGIVVVGGGAYLVVAHIFKLEHIDLLRSMIRRRRPLQAVAGDAPPGDEPLPPARRDEADDL